jgi:hypothetical protein
VNATLYPYVKEMECKNETTSGHIFLFQKDDSLFDTQIDLVTLRTSWLPLELKD